MQLWRALTEPWRRASRAFWRNAPRTLKVNSEGRAILGIALAVGFAAINTGNNLLYLGWGMVLSAIVLSGLLSEASLRSLRTRVRYPGLLRVGELGVVPFDLDNGSRRLPSFGIEIAAVATHGGQVQQIFAPYQLRIEPAAERRLIGRFSPPRRGAYTVLEVTAATRYPFGFFEKARRYAEHRVTFWAAPERRDVEPLLVELSARLGRAPTHRAGNGEDFFSLRPFRAGDDPRRIAWRPSARSGRRLVRENEALAASAVLLVLPQGPADAPQEQALATAGSLAEVLLARGYRVGLWGPGTLVPPEGGGGQVEVLLGALARMDTEAALPPTSHSADTPRLGFSAGARIPDGVDILLDSSKSQATGAAA